MVSIPISLMINEYLDGLIWELCIFCGKVSIQTVGLSLVGVLF